MDDLEDTRDESQMISGCTDYWHDRCIGIHGTDYARRTLAFARFLPRVPPREWVGSAAKRAHQAIESPEVSITYVSVRQLNSLSLTVQ